MSTIAQAANLPAVARKRICVVDPHPICRAALRDLLNHEPDLQVVAETDSAIHALAILRDHPVDAIVSEISLRGTDGLELVKRVRAEQGALPVLLFSGQPECTYAMRALRAGANGYLTKRAEPEVIVTGVRAILAGKLALSETIKDAILARFLDGRAKEPPLEESLSDRELEIFRMVGEGRISSEIAERLNLSQKTVESHRLHIIKRLELQSSRALVECAVAWVAGAADALPDSTGCA